MSTEEPLNAEGLVAVVGSQFEVVIEGGEAPAAVDPTKPQDRYAYSLQEIAELAQVKETTVRQYIRQGRFDPRSLKAVVEFVVARKGRMPETTEMDSQRRAEAICGVGILVHGQREDGEVIFGFDFEANPVFADTLKLVQAKLRKAGYVQGVHLLAGTNSYSVKGWCAEG